MKPLKQMPTLMKIDVPIGIVELGLIASESLPRPHAFWVLPSHSMLA